MICVNDLFFSYTDAPPWLLSDISLQVAGGEYISVVGDNGSGKSTLLRLLLGFLRPTKGTAEVGARRIGYVPQRQDSLGADFPITVYEVLYSYCKLLGKRGAAPPGPYADGPAAASAHTGAFSPQKPDATPAHAPDAHGSSTGAGGIGAGGSGTDSTVAGGIVGGGPPAARIPALIDAALAQVDLSGKKRALIGDLSGGQHQKVLLARALLGDPDLLILDEPSTGVDPSGQEEIYAFLKNLNDTRGLTILSVEHNLDAAIANSTKIFHMANGHGHICSPRQFAKEMLGG
ncbi:MAG: ATP-binding cassette domain-containing protein [Lachnospiraceae bacterium]|jgi:ABC-type Mn2+/Zn2+ transport system ATPase subunit|nr:ATP-binding cassette domain-containing protein [Lachnospiraceae bacterium]